MKNINLNFVVKILSLAVVLATSFFVFFVFYLEIFASQQFFDFGKEAVVPQNEINKKPIRMLFFGDMMLDRHVGEKIAQAGIDYIFEKLDKEKFFSGYNLIGCNLEGAVTDNGAHYNPVMSYDFAFVPKLINELKNYNFNFFNLANNHFADQGERGIIETRENLDELGFNYVGCPDGIANDCSVKTIELSGKRIGVVGFSMVYSELNDIEIRDIIENLAGQTDVVIVNIHWGVEYEHQFNKIQQKIARTIIDAGADIIIGHHPHVVQGIEIYKGKLIFYSLGNFIFDQYFSRDTQEGLAVGINLDDDGQKFFFYPLKSKLSAVELMDDNEKKIFFNQLISWSEIDEENKEKIIKGALSAQSYE